MPAGIRALAVAGWTTVFVLVGCNSPEQKQQASIDALQSWQATLRMTSEALARRQIPAGYARQVLEAAREHERANQPRQEWQSLPSPLKREFAAAARRLASALGESSERPDR